MHQFVREYGLFVTLADVIGNQENGIGSLIVEGLCLACIAFDPMLTDFPSSGSHVSLIRSDVVATMWPSLSC